MANQHKTIPTIILYHRPGCHLCDDAREVIQEVRKAVEFEFVETDIESDLLLLDAYRNDIPVVMIDGREAFRHRINAGEFLKLLNKW